MYNFYDELEVDVNSPGLAEKNCKYDFSSNQEILLTDEYCDSLFVNSVPVNEEIYENLLYVARPYRKRLRIDNWLPIRKFLPFLQHL